mgnify:CR=1 FL=1
MGLGGAGDLDDFVDVYNHFYGPQGLNVHCEYGYIIQPEFATALSSTITLTRD